MLNLLVSFVFYVINFIASTILSPILWLLSIFVGDGISSTTTLVINSIFNFFDMVSNYIFFFIDILCIPRSLFIFLFSIMLGIMAFVAAARIYVFTIAIYNHFKP